MLVFCWGLLRQQGSAAKTSWLNEWKLSFSTFLFHNIMFFGLLWHILFCLAFLPLHPLKVVISVLKVVVWCQGLAVMESERKTVVSFWRMVFKTVLVKVCKRVNADLSVAVSAFLWWLDPVVRKYNLYRKWDLHLDFQLFCWNSVHAVFPFVLCLFGFEVK